MPRHGTTSARSTQPPIDDRQHSSDHSQSLFQIRVRKLSFHWHRSASAAIWSVFFRERMLSLMSLFVVISKPKMTPNNTSSSFRFRELFGLSVMSRQVSDRRSNTTLPVDTVRTNDEARSIATRVAWSCDR